MRIIARLIAGLWLFSLPAAGQSTYTVSGKVTDEHDRPLTGASVVLTPSGNGMITGASVVLSSSGNGMITGADGTFRLEGQRPGELVITIAYLGYKRYSDTLNLSGDVRVYVKLVPSYQTLHEVVITGDHTERMIKQNPLNAEIVNDEFMRRHLQGSLGKTLERLPGMSTIDIGTGQSKPLIRGLGFNRVVVVENGVRHEGQQWGADHGLEIDQFAVDRVEVIRGPASLLYGSDAIGGVIRLEDHRLPVQHSAGGRVDLTGKSNGGYLGSSAMVYARGEQLFMTLRATVAGHGDYRVPADSVDIYSFRAPLDEGRLRNTAGREQNLHLSAGWVNNGFSTRIFASRVDQSGGFFANAHGLEPRRVDTAVHDVSSRDILDPRHDVRHTRLISRTTWRKDAYRVEAELGYQRNVRREISTYVSHGYMPPVFPDTLPFPAGLERAFDKTTWSASLQGEAEFRQKAVFTAGLQAEQQRNHIDGWGFIIPAFRLNTLGTFSTLKYRLSDDQLLHAGVRYDHGRIATEAYHDWFMSLVDPGDPASGVFLQRAGVVERTFNSFTWSAGYNLNREHIMLKANVGRGFRMPIAKELAANGVNYHRFSYEVGDSGLEPEVAYQLDGGLEWHDRRLAVGVTPFVTWFSNYIYLNPGTEHDRLYGNGNQVFTYTQAQVFRHGGEVHAHYRVTGALQLGLIGEYVHSVQLTGPKSGFTLPFSPPATLLLNARVTPGDHRAFSKNYLSLDVKMAAAQNRVVPPEEKTAGYVTVNLGAGSVVEVSGREVEVSLQVHNLLNSKYFNHNSYYRLINVPAPGRNVTLQVAVPFGGREQSKN